jgi:hypothetical protein
MTFHGSLIVYFINYDNIHYFSNYIINYIMNSDKIVCFALLLMIIVIVPAIYLYNEYECNKEKADAVADAIDETVKDLSDAIMNKEDFGEVFHISDNVYTYQQAEGVCKKYGAKLATRKQIKDAQAKGANWCSYGWSAGGEAYYPIQKEFLDNLPADKKGMCGKVGVNGGVFDDKNIQFGVNCYGKRPSKDKATENIAAFNEQWASNSNVKVETFMVDDKVVAVLDDGAYDDKYHPAQ